MEEKRKIIFSGMQPSGIPTLGNYLGAFKNWTKLQNEYDCIYCIADLHSITVRQDPTVLRKMTRNLFAFYLAIGLDFEKHIIYCQSHVPAHSELGWILNCYSYFGEVSRMTQFKEKSKKLENNISVGLFDYPVLQAADILLYNTNFVPVGEDQRQHLELARDIAIRFNNIYGEVFTVPEVFINKVSSKVMGLQNPTQKMSKSDSENPNNVIFLSDDLNLIVNKIKRSVTDSENNVKFTDEKPGISNLISIYSSLSGKTIDEIEKEFKGIGYGAFKTSVAEALVEEIRPIQKKFKEISSDKVYIDSCLKIGSEKANKIAFKNINKIKKKVGFII